MQLTTNTTATPIKISFVLPKTYALFNQQCLSPFGGAEVDFYYLATTLAKDPAFDVSCIVGDFGQPPIETRENVKLIRSVNLNKNPLIGARQLWKALHHAHADIYMLETPSLGLPLVAWFCKIHKCKFAYRTAHTRETDGTYLKQHPILGRSFLWALKKTDVVFAQNQEDLVRLRQLFNIPSIVAPNGHRIPPLSDNPRDTILWVGRSASVKRPELFFKLAKEFPQQHFTMVCQKATGDEKYEQLISQAKDVKNLEFVQRLTFQQTASYFQRAQLFVNTSDSEGFPNTFIQACLAATPILSLSVNPDNFLDQHHCGLCSNGDWTKFKEMFKQILDHDFAVKLSKNARQYVEQYHNIDTIAAQYKSIFQNLLNS